jgi:hypothetical protein
MHTLRLLVFFCWLAARSAGRRARLDDRLHRRLPGHGGGVVAGVAPPGCPRVTVDSDDIDHRYAAAIACWDIQTGRDRHGMTIYERRKLMAWRKAGCSVDDAIAVLLEDVLDD